MAVAFPDGIRSSTSPIAAKRLDAPTLHRLQDGTVVALRHLGPADAPRIRAGFDRLSPTSRYRRFFTGMPRLSDDMLRRLADLDGWQRVAIGAETLPAFGGQPFEAGVARFHRLPGRADLAEVAVTVIDDLQRRGLGGVLLRELARVARELGVRTFVANVLPDNDPMIRLIGRLDPRAESHFEEGLRVFEIALSPNAIRAARSAPPRAA